MKKIIIVFALLMTGCATINSGSTQSVRVTTDKTLEPTQCNLSNEEGTWHVLGNEKVTIHRDGNPMKVDCENSKQIGSNTVSPKFLTHYLLIDIILIDACIISCIIDGANNSFYEYPSQIIVPMQSK